MGSENNQKQNNQWGGHGEGAEPKRTGGGGGGTPEPTTRKSAAPELQFQSPLGGGGRSAVRKHTLFAGAFGERSAHSWSLSCQGLKHSQTQLHLIESLWGSLDSLS